MLRKALFLMVVLNLCGVSFAKYVAVLETAADSAVKGVVSMSERQYLTNVLREKAVRVLPAELNFTIMTRENILQMLPPGKAIEDCEGSCLVETGKNIAADYVAQARIGMFGSSLTISAELYETAGNKLLASFNGRSTSVDGLVSEINDKAPEFFKKARGENSWGKSGIGNFNDVGEFTVGANQKFIVDIETEPMGATLSVDGRPEPKCISTPCRILVDAGEHRFIIKIAEVNLPLGGTREEFDVILEEFFKTHPQVHHCITFNSKAHLVGQFLLRTNRRNVQIMGYDMVPKNAECVRQGSISFLIAQHAYMQGYACVDTLFQAIVLRKEVTPVNYMPIELLTKENIEFYRRTNIG